MHVRTVGNWPPTVVGAWPHAQIVGVRPQYGYAPPGYAHLVGQGAAPMAMAPYDAMPLIGSVPGGNPAGPAVVANNGPGTIGQYPIGFGPQSIPKGGATQNVVTRNQVQYYQPTRFVVIDNPADGGAATFSIEDIKLGQKSQLINSNPIPAAAFVQTATDSLVSFTTAVAGQDLVIEVSNLDPGNPHFFQAMFLGRAVGV